MQETIAANSIAQAMWSDIVASRYELLLFVVSLLGYIIVVKSRQGQKSAKRISCQADLASEVSQVDSTVEEVVQDSVYPEDDSGDVQSTIAELLESKQFDKACDFFELNYSALFEIDMDAEMEQCLLMSALKCGRQSLAEHLLQTSQTNYSKHVVKIQQWWKRSSAKMSDSRVEHMHDVLNRMAQMFNDLHPFEDENSDGESTCALGEDSEADDGKSVDNDWDDSELWS